jgi:sulfite exporter TauE/SafE
VLSAAIVSGGLLLVYKLEDVDLSQAWFYTAHTFLDSTPDSWLSPECRADPTENCREADGLAYFGPADLRAGVVPLAMNHPLTTLAKTARSAWDNLWTLLGSNLSTFPGIIPFVVVALALVPSARELYRRLALPVWIAVAAVTAESLLPPLSWAPPHPQYHLQLVFPIVMLVVPILVALARMPHGKWLALAFLIGNAGLSAIRYTRYAGY